MKLTELMFNKYKYEMKNKLPRLQEKWKETKTFGTQQEGVRKSLDGKEAIGSTSFQDCLFLYLLVRMFRPTRCFEIGTYIGASAVIIAEALIENGMGQLYTCDKRDLSVIPKFYPHIKIIKSSSMEFLTNLKGIKFDFVFIDGWCKKSLIRQEIPILESFLTDDAILSFHDYKKGQKGNVCKKIIDEYIENGEATGYFKKELEWVEPQMIFSGDTQINNSTLVLKPIK